MELVRIAVVQSLAGDNVDLVAALVEDKIVDDLEVEDK